MDLEKEIELEEFFNWVWEYKQLRGVKNGIGRRTKKHKGGNEEVRKGINQKEER